MGHHYGLFYVIYTSTQGRLVDKYPHMGVSSYSKVDAVEQEDMVNSGVRGMKDRNLNPRTEVGCKGIAMI
jgi:hypothetical protein